MQTSKKCFKCIAIKNLAEFYTHPKMADGHLNKCKECTRIDVATSRLARKEYYQEYDRRRAKLEKAVAARKAYRTTERGKLAASRARITSRHRHPEKHKARDIVNNAIRDGLIKKSPCEECGSTARVHGHHDNYERPLDVRWLCHPCHMKHHAALKATTYPLDAPPTAG